MAISTSPRLDPAWVAEFRKELARPVSEQERARRRQVTRELRSFRDSVPSIAPDTVKQYVRETREEEDARP